MNNNDLTNKLRDAVAKNKLFIITGTGVSNGVPKGDGSSIPSWGTLVKDLKDSLFENNNNIDEETKKNLNKLVPDNYKDDVHGDCLIEAAEIIANCSSGDKLLNDIANETKEKDSAFSKLQEEIANLPIKGIVTFNYDNCHESAFKAVDKEYEPCLYFEKEKLVSYIREDFEKKPLLLKAHGCTSVPKSIVLTSSSYANILNKEHEYRAFMQHILSRFTILILGFGLRDRDFEQILNTMEKDFGANIQDHIVVMRQNPKSSNATEKKEYYIQEADFAVLEARYGLKVLTVDEFNDIPILVKSLVKEGPLIEKLIQEAIGITIHSKEAKKAILNLGSVGKKQLKDRLITLLKINNEYTNKRAEIIYLLGLLNDSSSEVIEQLLYECEVVYDNDNTIEKIECIAHALLGLRALYIKDEYNRKKLISNKLQDKLKQLDLYLEKQNKSPRLLNYALAAYAEITQRNEYYNALNAHS